MRRNPDGTWHGDILDGLAFVKAQVDHGARPQGAKVLLLGAGGEGSAIAIALLEAGVAELVIHDVSERRRDALLALLRDVEVGERARAGAPDPTGCDIVCNATPIGMHRDDPLPMPVNGLKPSMFVGDVIAGHGVVPFLAAARDAGCRTATGDQMVEAVQDMMLDFIARTLMLASVVERQALRAHPESRRECPLMARR